MSTTKKATFGAGCFWGAEHAFRAIEGVVDTRVGFASAAGDDSVQIEVVQIEFDAARLAYPELVEHFWGLHNPTSIDRQGADSGTKYRSAIFVHDAEQQVVARQAKQALTESGRYSKPVVTHILELGAVEWASEDQQRYLEKHGKTSCSL